MNDVKKILLSKDNPEGVTLETLLRLIRKEILERCSRINRDSRKEADFVMHNNIRILDHLSDAIELSEENARYLDKHLGPPKSGEPRLG